MVQSSEKDVNFNAKNKQVILFEKKKMKIRRQFLAKKVQTQNILAKPLFFEFSLLFDLFY